MIMHEEMAATLTINGVSADFVIDIVTGSITGDIIDAYGIDDDGQRMYIDFSTEFMGLLEGALQQLSTDKDADIKESEEDGI